MGSRSHIRGFHNTRRDIGSAAGVAGVALDGVDDAIFAFFHNADVIGFAVLRAGCAVRVIPVKENDHAGRGINRVIRPLPVAAEPLSNRFTRWF